MKIIIVSVVAFGLGVLLSPTKVQTIQKPADYSQWNELKRTDDAIILTASFAFGVAANSIDHISKGDLTAVEQDSKDLANLAKKISDLKDERAGYLIKLGY